MKTVKLDIRNIHTPQALQIYLQYMLGFRDGYGRNLDALYDELTQICEPLCIRLETGDALGEQMKAYLPRLMRVLEDSAQDNPQLTIL